MNEEITEKMVDAAIAEFCAQAGDSYTALVGQMTEADRKEMRDDWRHILEAAWRAR